MNPLDPRARRPLLAVALAALVAGCAGAGPTADDLSPAYGKRVEGDRGMVAASHPDAAGAGAEILRAGGNAVDAAVATAFALSVTDISQTGLGGGGSLTFYDARRRSAVHLSFYPRAGSDPAWAVADTAAPASRAAGRAAGVPGMVAGLVASQLRFGRLPLDRVIAPALRLARDGFVVTPLLSRTILSARARLEADSAARALLLPDGQPLRPGDRLVQPALAQTLARIAADSGRAFYRGEIAERLALDVQARGGLISVRDLQQYPVRTMQPICAEWMGHTVLAAPPPHGGAHVVEMLRMSEASGLTRARGLSDNPEAVVRLAGLLRLAQADASWWRGDPAVMTVPTRGLASATYAAERAALIPMAANSATESVTRGDPQPHEGAPLGASCTAYDGAAAPASAAPAGESLTSHLAVVDGDGNAVSATTTVGVLFGSGVYSGGFFLNSSASNFDDRTRGTDRYANTTMAPTIILDGARVRLVIGAAGSQYIQPAITQVALRVLAFGEDAGRAIAAPRIQTSAGRREVEVEPGFSPAVYEALVRTGYRPASRIADITFGGVHAIHVTTRGRRIGVADPRRDGAAAAQ